MVSSAQLRDSSGYDFTRAFNILLLLHLVALLGTIIAPCKVFLRARYFTLLLKDYDDITGSDGPWTTPIALWCFTVPCSGGTNYMQDREASFRDSIYGLVPGSWPAVLAESDFCIIELRTALPLAKSYLELESRFCAVRHNMV